MNALAWTGRWTAAALIASACVMVACEEKKEPAKDVTKAVEGAGKKMSEAGQAAGDAVKKAGETVKAEAGKAADAAKEAADKARAALEEEARKAGDAFEKQLKDLGGMLEGITTKAQAEAKKADIAKAVDAVNAAGAAAQKMTGDAKAAFDAKIAPVLQKVKDQIARLLKNPDTATTLAEPLGKVNLSK